MKTLHEIKNEIKTTADEICDTEKQIDLLCEKISENAKTRFIQSRDENKALHGEIAEISSKQTDLKIKLKILQDNEKTAFKAENIANVLNVWNKYAGKKYGEKTRQKIYYEIKAATNCSAYIRDHGYTQELVIGELSERGYSTYLEIRLYTKYNDGDKKELVNNNNVIQAINAADLNMYGEKPYTDDINGRISEIKTAYNKLLELNKRYNDEIDKYNDMIPETMTRIKTADYLYQNII